VKSERQNSRRAHTPSNVLISFFVGGSIFPSTFLKYLKWCSCLVVAVQAKCCFVYLNIYVFGKICRNNWKITLCEHRTRQKRRTMTYGHSSWLLWSIHVYASIIPLQMGLIIYSFLLFIFYHTAHKRRGGLRA